METAKEKKEILSYRLIHTENTKSYFKFSWPVLWVLFKYKVIWGMDISFTVIKAFDREEYFVQFFAE